MIFTILALGDFSENVDKNSSKNAKAEEVGGKL